jgi:hypothetical protein
MSSQLEDSNVSADAERRTQSRSSIRLRATVLLPDDQLLFGHTIDVSIGGCCLSVPTQLLIDDECRLGLEFEAVGMKHNVLLIARVCYCAAQAEGFRAGMQFVQVTPGDAELISELLR